MQHSSTLYIVGWRELVRFPDWKGVKLKAKVDTGAKTSAIHAEKYEVIRQASTPTRIINEELRMQIKVGSSKSARLIWVQAPIVDYRNVKNSGGKIEERPFIQTKILVGGVEHPIILSVTNREKMKFPVLLGRSFLAGRYLVDPAQSHLT